ncbi:uncharacterized protein [Asterias amurensis]|uniref:uncharacterized protein n=1 Tax=Asterias amurensis TaxID=7602 RepID=UPI003AB5F987
MGRFCFDFAFCSLVFLFLAIYSVDGHFSFHGAGSNLKGSESNSKGSGSSSKGGSHDHHAPYPQPCDSHPCQHGGVCQNKGKLFECVCPSGCSGRRCENGLVRDPCANNPCEHGGACSPYGSSYRCSCPSAYMGSRCQLGKKQKTTRSSGSGSTSSGSGGHTNPHHSNSKSSSGSKEVPGPVQDPCANNPCEHGGACSPYGSSYRCSCPSAYMGSRCQFGKKQKTTRSSGSGSTSSGSGGHTNPHHSNSKSSSGSKEVPGPVQDPCANNPCEHGGACSPYGSSYRCSCPSAYSGSRCQFGKKQKTTRSSGSGSTSSGSGGHTNPHHSNSKSSSGSKEVPGPVQDPCANNPCEHGGACSPYGSSYRCSCPSAYSGSRCQFGKKQKTTRSSGSGSTSSGSGGHTNPHHSNSQSSSGSKEVPGPVQDPCANNPCEHGGACSRYGSSYRCRCPSAYMGSRCQIGKTQHPTKSSSKESGSSSHGNSKSGSGDHSPKRHRSGSKSESKSGSGSGRGSGSGSGSNERIGRCRSPCEKNPCKRGSCQVFGKTFKCKCPSGFKGRRCQFTKRPRTTHSHGSRSSGSSSSTEIPAPQPCDYNPCWNGGTCLPEGDPYTCKCRPGYAGRRCEIAPVPNPCEQDPCSGHGKCYSTRDGGYRCECNPNYGGSRCNHVIKVNPCDRSPCKNDGRCLTRGDDYQCHCMFPYEGTNCEQVQPGPCEDSPCTNGGTCFPDGRDFYCQCTKRFEGKRCEIATAVGPCESEPCFNGGTCKARGSEFKCACKPSYSGNRCEDSPNENDHVILESTNGEMEDVDIPLMAFYTHSSYLLRFSVMCYDSVRIGFKSAVYSHVYYYVYLGKTSARIEHCENKCQSVSKVDISGQLSATAFADYYIRFTSTGSLIVGILDASFTELMSFNGEPPTCPMLVFVSSGDGYVATWKIYEAITEQVNTITWRTVNVNLRADHYTYLGESFQVYDRQLRLGLAIDSEVTVLLSKGYDDVNTYEIVFRAAGNTKLQIKKNGKVVKEGDCVINSSSRDDFEDLWISFAKKTISVGRVGLNMQPAFVSWSDTSPLEVSLAAFKGASSSYLVYYKFEYQTARGIFWTFDCDMAYPLPFEKIHMPQKALEIGLTADRDAHFSIAASDEDSPEAPMYEVVIGAEDNTKCLIRKCKECECMAEADCPHILDKNKQVDFTFEFEFGHLKLFKGKGASKSAQPIMSCEDREPLIGLEYLALSTGFESDGESHWKTYNV